MSRGSFPGWPFSASSPLVLQILQMTSSRVSSLSPSLRISSLTIRILFCARSVVMTVGSPALAAYSLVLTSLSARLVYHRAKTINHESKRDVTTVLVSVQQTPLELTKDERLLGPIPKNDRWRQEITDRLNWRNSWSLATGSSIAWVVIAFVFTLIDSFVSLDSTVDNASQGHAVGTLWLWLLCLVIGWLWVPTFSSRELRSAFEYANREAAEGVAGGQRQASQPTGRETSQEDRPPPGTSHSRPTAGTSRFIPPGKDPLLIKQGITSLNRDEHRLTPTFNYSRIMRYLVLVDDVLGVLHQLSQEQDEVGLSRKPLIDVVSLIFDRRVGLPLVLLPLCLRRRSPRSLRELSPQCSSRRFLALFSSAERPLQPRSS